MAHPYDELSEARLRSRPSMKWQKYPRQVLPLWVADMDFPPAPAIGEAISEFCRSGDLGYPPKEGLAGLGQALCDRLADRYRLEFEPDQLLLLPGIVPGLFLSCRALAGPGEGVVVQPPVYPPFMMAVRESGRRLVCNPMSETDAGWRFDLDGLEQAISPATRLLMLCNPQNPTGRVFSREELESLAEIALRHRLWVVSDELHADLALDGEHVPFATLGPEVAQRTVTLYGPTKAFNIAGLKIGFAASHNGELLERLRALALGMVVPGNVLAQVAAIAAYRHGASWLDGTIGYLRENRSMLTRFVAGELPGVSLHAPEGTYLAWLDFRALALDEPAADYLVEHARVGLNPGSDFGCPPQPGFEGFVRLNFATSRQILGSALGRIRDALPPADRK